MAKDLSKTEEAGIRPPAAEADKVGPVAGPVDPKSDTVAVPEAKTGTPLEHAKALKLHRTEQKFATIAGTSPTLEVFSPQHLAAEALHGWKEHEHHEGQPIRLSEDDYKAALLAAYTPVTRASVDFERHGLKIAKGDDVAKHKIDSHKAAELGLPTTTDYEPHKPALSPHNNKG